MATCNSNIENFNKHVNSAVRGLKARNNAIDDILTYLFTGYKIASSTKFIEYNKLQETQCMQGSDVSTDLLIQALNDYDSMIINNTWGAPSDEQRQIVLLLAELKTTKDSNIKLSKSVIKKLKNSKQRDTCEDG